jgi:hypothetical protein
MNQMIEIMHFSMSIFLRSIFDTSSLYVAQTSCQKEDGPKRTTLGPGEEIHKVCRLAMLVLFNKVMQGTSS